MLHDPPHYVNVPAALIYDLDEPEREIHHAALQIIGWMWVRKRSGRPLVTSVAELARRWKVAERTVYDRLQKLAQRGYFQVSHVEGRVEIQPGALLAPHTGTETVAVTVTDTGTARAQADGAGGASSLGRPDTNDVVGGGPLPLDKAQQQQQKLLLAADVFADVAARLAADPWVTAKRIKGWTAALRADRTIRNLPACLAANLAAHREPPPSAEEMGRRRARRYIEGEFSEFIQH